MARLFDCFLYHDEEILLEIRLQLLSDIVDRFVIVCSNETFTGRQKSQKFPIENVVVQSLNKKIELITLDHLEGKSAWNRESYQRNQMAAGLNDACDEDVVMVSDVDEIPRPSVLASLKHDSMIDTIKVLELDYFNFKFNFKQFHGVHAVWAGPTVCKHSNFTSPQSMRDSRWAAMSKQETSIPNAGWHFSFLTETGDVSEKLKSFSHQEQEVQSRTHEVSELLEQRQGFRDHMQPGAVWGFVDPASFDCGELESLMRRYPGLCNSDLIDDPTEIQDRIRRCMKSVCSDERAKILRLCTTTELLGELRSRALRRVSRLRQA